MLAGLPSLLSRCARGEIRRDVGEVDELGGEVHEAVEVGEVGGEPERRADGAAGRQADRADVVVEGHAVAELPADAASPARS